MIGFCPLSSGSKGNATFLGSKESKILIDVGISYKELVYRLEKINVSLDDIDAILITHEHGDHIDGLKTILIKKNIPVFVNSTSAKAIYEKIKILPNYTIFTTDEIFCYKDLEILPFGISHDAGEPVGFVIYTHNLKIGYCADIGFVSSFVLSTLKDCDILYIEANHDEDLLEQSKRPEYIKKRILGRQGHLSNKECGIFLEKILCDKLKAIYISHLSFECNSEKKAYDHIESVLKKSKHEADLFIAYQEKVSKFWNFL